MKFLLVSNQVSSQMYKIQNSPSILKNQSKEYEAARDNYSFIKLKRLIEKPDKSKQNADICRIHLEVETSPMHLFVRNFLKPTIKINKEDYMKNFNLIIRKTQ